MTKYVLLGGLGALEDHTEKRQFNILEIIVHPNHNRQHRRHNIALLKINGPVEYNDNIRPVCLSDLNTQLSNRLIVAGWGVTTPENDINSHLQRVRLNLVPYAECNTSYKSYLEKVEIDNDEQICAASKIGEVDACQVSYNDFSA